VSRLDNVNALKDQFSGWDDCERSATRHCGHEAPSLHRMRRAGSCGEGGAYESEDVRPRDEIYVVVFLCCFLETKQFLRTSLTEEEREGRTLTPRTLETMLP
jgi:hypothetical protein